MPFAADQQGGALFQARTDVTLHALVLLLADERTELRVRLVGIPDLYGIHRFHDELATLQPIDASGTRMRVPAMHA